MRNTLNNIHRYFLLKLHSLTIKQANIFTTLFIFVFTIIFAYLLIKENYQDYERALFEQKTHYDSTLLSEEEQLKQTQKKLKTLLIKNTIAIATLAFILFAIMLGLHKIFNTILQRDIDAFLDFFRETAHNEQVLNQNAVVFKEFKTMVRHANNMLHTISDQKRELRELNVSLEDKVKVKTQDLKDILDAQKEFLRYTVHETNTPLSVILTSLELYEMKHQKDKHLSKVEAAAKNIFNIYDDLSYLVKKDQVEYQKVAINIEQLIQSRIDFFSEVALLSNVEFRYASEVKNIYIYFNETKLQRVLDNTLTNAIKYTYQNEMIDVSLNSNGMHVEFSVGSHSQPIKDVDKIFDAYYREDTQNSEAIQGFGIGLQLVKNICDEESVDISITSDSKMNIFAYKFKVMGE